MHSEIEFHLSLTRQQRLQRDIETAQESILRLQDNFALILVLIDLLIKQRDINLAVAGVEVLFVEERFILRLEGEGKDLVPFRISAFVDLSTFDHIFVTVVQDFHFDECLNRRVGIL